MSKKNFVVILGLSVVVTYLTPAVEILIGGLSLAGADRGFPFTFSSSSFSGITTFNYVNFLVDTVIWFVILFVIWKFISKKN